VRPRCKINVDLSQPIGIAKMTPTRGGLRYGKKLGGGEMMARKEHFVEGKTPVTDVYVGALLLSEKRSGKKTKRECVISLGHSGNYLQI